MKKSIYELLSTIDQINETKKRLCDMANIRGVSGDDCETVLNAASLLKDYKELLYSRMVEI